MIPRYTNAEILHLIASGRVSYLMRVFSTDYSEVMYFNGTVFVGECTCKQLGSYPVKDCNHSIDSHCKMVKEAWGEIVEV